MFKSHDWVAAERRAEEDQLIYAERLAAEEARLAGDFKAAVLAGNVDICLHGRTTGQRISGVWTPNARPEALWETMLDTSDYGDLSRTCMRALALLARKGEIEATEALDALARRYGHMTAEAE